MIEENVREWNKLVRFGGYMAIAVVALIPLQMFIFISWPPPENAHDFFTLFNENPFLGLLSLDLLYLINNALLIFVYLGLFAVLRKASLAAMIAAITLGFIGIAAYYSSSVAFEMLILSRKYAMAAVTENQIQWLAAGEALLAVYKGSAFDVYYILNGVALLIIAIVILRDNNFSRATGIWGLASAVLMTIPSTAGAIGLIFSIASLIPWIVFSIMIAIRMTRHTP
jgi:hypothetical protein